MRDEGGGRGRQALCLVRAVPRALCPMPCAPSWDHTSIPAATEPCAGGLRTAQRWFYLKALGMVVEKGNTQDSELFFFSLPITPPEREKGWSKASRFAVRKTASASARLTSEPCNTRTWKEEGAMFKVPRLDSEVHPPYPSPPSQ